MISRSSVRHLRIPFSLFLMPVFFFALSLTPNLDGERLVIVFLALHLFLYPSSNGYNSYFDKDEESIGGLKHPPKVTSDLYWLSHGFLLIAVVLGLMISWSFASMLMIYAGVSMAYSHPSIRIKKYPWASWFVAGFFQGYFTFAAAYAGLSDLGWDVFMKSHVALPGLLTSLMLWANYPLTQIYQHREDSRRGDLTLSLKLGIRGTFIFSAILFVFTGIAFISYYLERNQESVVWIYLLAMTPVIVFFLFWWRSSLIHPMKYVSYSWAMMMNWISASALNAFFIYYFLKNTQVLQAFS
jgi:1,4-dihydroxy-2-naphthoate octaprenyltransferase